MVKKKKVAEAETTEPKQREAAILFELENIAVPGRQIVFDVLKSVLAEKKAKLTPLMFSRHCLRPLVKRYLSSLLDSLGKGRLSEDKLLAEITQGISLSLTDGTVKGNPQLGKFLKTAIDKGTRVGALSTVGQETAKQLMEKCGFDEMGVDLLAYACDEENSHNINMWQSLSETISVKPTMCVAITTSADLCGEALAAGMRCVVVPDKFTAFQDFGGADLIADSLDDSTIRELFALLELL